MALNPSSRACFEASSLSLPFHTAIVKVPFGLIEFELPQETVAAIGAAIDAAVSSGKVNLTNFFIYILLKINEGQF